MRFSLDVGRMAGGVYSACMGDPCWGDLVPPLSYGTGYAKKG